MMNILQVPETVRELAGSFDHFAAVARAEALLRKTRSEADTTVSPQTCRIVLSGNCTMDFMAPGLYVGLALEGYEAETTATEYNDTIGAILDGELDGDFWVLWLSAKGFSKGGTARSATDIAGLANAVQRLVDRGRGVIVILPEALATEDNGQSAFTTWRKSIVREIEQTFPNAVIMIDPDTLKPGMQCDDWHGTRYWTTAKAPLHPDAATRVGQEVGRLIARSLKPSIKAIAVDLDNTLWGGIVGEDEAGGVLLDPESTGRPYLEMQRFLKDMAELGVPLAVVSKNNADDARTPFKSREEMILKEDDFVAFHANWNSKSESILKIRDQLGIGMDAICFIDDSPHERLEAASLLPDLYVPDLPEDPDERVPALIRSGLFTFPSQNDEDRRRVELYKAERARQEMAATTTDRTDYLRSLEMMLVARPIGETNLARVVSLVQKTNQFNLTNNRHGATAISEIAANPENYAYCYSVKDRFGDAGIVGVVMGIAEGDKVEIDTWLMSCRVINRGVEIAIADHFKSWIDERSKTEVVATYNKTPKNGLVANLFDDLGLEVDEEQPQACRYVGANFGDLTHFLTIQS